jgi:hypothetical protein
VAVKQMCVSVREREREGGREGGRGGEREREGGREGEREGERGREGEREREREREAEGERGRERGREREREGGREGERDDRALRRQGSEGGRLMPCQARDIVYSYSRHAPHRLHMSAYVSIRQSIAIHVMNLIRRMHRIWRDFVFSNSRSAPHRQLSKTAVKQQQRPLLFYFPAVMLYCFASHLFRLGGDRMPQSR